MSRALTGHPYRENPITTGTALVALRRPRGGAWVCVVGAGAFVVGAIMGVSAIGVMIMGLGAGLQFRQENRRRRVALAQIERLPFPVHHSSAAAIDPNESARAMGSLTIRLARVPAPDALDRICRAAEALAPGLVARVDHDQIVISGWPWGRHDVELLAALLPTWGVELHASHVVVAADVRWGAGGPLPSI